MTTTPKRFAWLVAVLLIAGGIAWAAETKTDAEQRLERSAKTLDNLDNAPDKGIPDEVYKSAKCIAVVPNLTKGGFIFGAERGRGVATCRVADGGWSAPAFFTISGGSWGAQIGIEDVHLVIMIMNDDGMRQMLNSKFKIGADASASAGPVGRHASAGTDWKLNTQMLTYSRSKGLFAGIDLSGAVMERDKDTTAALYGSDLPNSDVLTGKVTPPRESRVFLDTVARVKAEARADH